MDEIENKLSGIVGGTNVIDSPEILELFTAARSFDSRMTPRYVVRPQKAEQIQELVKWANETRTPLVPVSSGGKHRKGDTAPAVPQAIMVDLSGMKKIFSINKMFRMVVLEPGVTYAELQEALKIEGLMLDVPLAPRAEKSVIASVLETEPRLNPNMQWSSTEPLRCTEVVWGDGTLMRTGEAWGQPSKVPAAEAIAAEQANHGWQIAPNGPDTFDYYRLLTGAQGTMGIVTWASLKCALFPEIHHMRVLPADDPQKIIDFMYNIVHLRLGDSLFMVNNFTLASLMGNTPAEIQTAKLELPPWIGFCSAASRPPLPEKRVYAQEAGIERCAQQAGVKNLSAVGRFTGADILKKAFSPCSPGNYWKDIFKGSSADIFFLATMETVPAFINRMYELAVRERVSPEAIGIYVQPKHQGVNCHVEFILPYNPESALEVSRTRALFEKASRAFSGLGAYFSRPYGDWARLQINKDAMSADTLKKIKGVFDPNHILNPGKFSLV
jgi:FAD/FMN-containing dehydrogenase